MHSWVCHSLALQTWSHFILLSLSYDIWNIEWSYLLSLPSRIIWSLKWEYMCGKRFANYDILCKVKTKAEKKCGQGKVYPCYNKGGSWYHFIITLRILSVRTLRASLVAQTVKNLPAVQETWVRSLGWEDPLEKGMATHSSILAWRIPWTEKSSGLQSIELQRLEHGWVANRWWLQPWN